MYYNKIILDITLKSNDKYHNKSYNKYNMK